MTTLSPSEESYIVFYHVYCLCFYFVVYLAAYWETTCSDQRCSLYLELPFSSSVSLAVRRDEAGLKEEKLLRIIFTAGCLLFPLSRLFPIPFLSHTFFFSYLLTPSLALWSVRSVLHIFSLQVLFVVWFPCSFPTQSWPCGRGDVSSCCHWVLLQHVCSLILPLSFTLLPSQWASTTEPLSVLSVSLLFGA